MARRFKAGLLALALMRDRVRADGWTFEQAGDECDPKYSRQSAQRAILAFESKFGLAPSDPTPKVTPTGLATT